MVSRFLVEAGRKGRGKCHLLRWQKPINIWGLLDLRCHQDSQSEPPQKPLEVQIWKLGKCVARDTDLEVTSL